MTKDKSDDNKVNNNVQVQIAIFKENITPFNIRAEIGKASVVDVVFNPSSQVLEILFKNDTQTVMHLVPMHMVRDLIVFSEDSRLKQIKEKISHR